MRKRLAGRFRIEIVDRRPGDPGVLIATPEKIVRELGWSPRYGEIHDIVRDRVGVAPSSCQLDTARNRS